MQNLKPYIYINLSLSLSHLIRSTGEESSGSRPDSRPLHQDVPVAWLGRRELLPEGERRLPGPHPPRFRRCRLRLYDLYRQQRSAPRFHGRGHREGGLLYDLILLAKFRGILEGLLFYVSGFA